MLGANVVLTATTRIIDVSKEKPVEYKGIIPAKSVVIPGTYIKISFRKLWSPIKIYYW